MVFPVSKAEEKSFYSFKDDKIYIKIRVRARASASKIKKPVNGAIVICVTSVRENNKANMEAIKLLSEQFHVAKSKIRIVSGSKCRDKVVCINGKIDIEGFLSRISYLTFT